MRDNCSVGQYWIEKFGEKVYRISINGGFTCPTRDGTKGSKGCYFCDEQGSVVNGSRSSESISVQLEKVYQD